MSLSEGVDALAARMAQEVNALRAEIAELRAQVGGTPPSGPLYPSEALYPSADLYPRGA